MPQEKQKKRLARGRRHTSNTRYPIFVVAILALCLLIGFVCFWFYGKLQSTIHEESSGYLKEVSSRVSANIQQIINDTYAMLGSFTNTLEQSNASTFADFKAIALRDQQFWGYEQIFLINGDGTAYSVDGQPFALVDSVYLREALVNQNNAMSPLQMVDGKECAIFFVPFAERHIDGIPMKAVAVTYNAENFAQVMSMSSFDKQAYSHIVSKDGTLIIRSQAENGMDFGYNIFASIDRGHLFSKFGSSTYKEDIQANKSGQITFELNGRQEYMVYSPIPPNDWYLLTFVPLHVVNEKSNLLLGITLIISGFITASFALLTVTMLITFWQHRHRLEQIAYVDDVTGGNTIERFYELARESLETPGHPNYALVYTNINKFKVLNETFGRHTGDEILRCFNNIVEASLKSGEYIGRLSADNFCILIEYESCDHFCNRLLHWYDLALDQAGQTHSAWTLPRTDVGLYVIENDSMPFPLMIDRAKLALQELPYAINSKLRYAMYNDKVRAQLFREKQLEDMMEDALRHGEFQMYLQPKYRARDHRIVGAEALTRWVSTTEGMIFPDEFIPLFEKNGFIAQLDLWIFEEVCKLIHTLLEEGTPIKISVNCSRAHMRDAQLVQNYHKIADKHKVPTALIEIELTESFVLEDAELFKRVVEEIHSAGFGCSMDDFGSGYSSLNMIQDLTVDTLKLDKIFFSNAERDPARTESVIGSIINMGKALSMETVAEGVEHEEQVEMLCRIGCDLIQGFVFARPMPAEKFHELLREQG